MSNLLATIIESGLCRTKVFPRPVPTLFFFPGLSSFAIHKNNPKFDQTCTLLQNNFDFILEEYRNLAKQPSDYTLQPGEQNLHKGGWDWNSFILKGKKQSNFQQNCPRTTSILESVPGLMFDTPFSYAFFSTLRHNSSISRHSGPCNLRIRCHFPLIVPDANEDFGMTIGSETIKWKVGEPIFFDDCYEHNVWNHSKEDRVVLLFDMW